MKKIIILLLSIILVFSFSVTAFAEPIEPNNPNNTPEQPTVSQEPSSSQESSSSEASDSSSETNSSNTIIQPEPQPQLALEIVEFPKKTVYEVGETLNVSGLKVNILDGSGIFVSRDGANLSISPTALNAEGKQLIEVKYQDAIAYFEVTVNAKHIHKFGEWKTQLEPSCVADGKKVQKCECGAIVEEVIQKLGHDWDEGQITKDPTTESEGQMKYVCSRCKEELLENLPILAKDDTVKKEFKFVIKWWMIFVPIGFIIVFYILAMVIIFKKKV